MRSAPITLESRCAKMRVVRPCISRSSALWMTASFSASTAESASSRIRIGSIAQQRAGDRDALALPSREPDASLADDRVVALRQPRDELVGVRGARRGLDLLAGGVGPAEPQVLLHGAVKEVGVLVHHRDVAVDVVRPERSQVVSADPNRALVGVVEAKEQPHDGGLPRPALPHEPDPLPRLDPEREPAVRGAASAGVGERHVVELHHRRERAVELDRRRRRLHLRVRVQHREDVVRGGAAHHAVVQQRAEIALGAEHLDAHHQDDEQHVEAHLAVHHPPGPEREHRGAPHRDAGVGEAPGERVGREHPHRAPEDLVRALGQQPAALGALPERLQRRETLHRVQELRREPRYAFDRRMLLFASQRWNTAGANRVNIANANIRAATGKSRNASSTRTTMGVMQGDQELRQVLAEVGLELLDPVDHGDHDRAGALQPEVGGAERRHPGVEPLAQLELHHRRGTVGDHGAGVLQPAAEHHHRRHQRERHHELRERVPGEDPREQPPEQGEPPDPDQRREHPHRHRGGDPQSHAVRELPEAGVEEHGRCSSEGEGVVTQVWGFVPGASRLETDARSLGNDVPVVKAVTHSHVGRVSRRRNPTSVPP